MAKQTGQITVLKNNKVTNVEHQIRFIFTKNNGERITRDTTAKGIINFDIPNGDWNVSWFAVDGDQKVLPLRAGLQLKITSSTPATALADWIYGDNTHVADPILAQWTDVLDEMKAVRNQFRDETQQDGTGKFVMQSSTKSNSLKDSGAYNIANNPLKPFAAGDHGLTSIQQLNILYPNFKVSEYFVGESHVHYYVQQNFSTTKLVVFFNGYLGGGWAIATQGRDDVWIFEGYKNNLNTTIGNHGQLHDGKGKPKDLMAVGDFGLGSISLERVGDVKRFARGMYYDSPNVVDDSSVSTASIIIGGYCGTAGGALYIDRHGNARSYGRYLSEWSVANIHLTNRNTVIDSNGNYKPASPVIQLHHDRVEYNEDFDKDNPPEFEHLETGVYRITNVREICKDGWTYNKPLNGKSQPYFMIKYEQEDETTLLVRVFERTFDKNTGEFGFGEPRDIGVDERWIDFHFEVDHERIAREEAQMQKEQEEFEEQERLRKEAEANARYEAEMARQEAELLAEMEVEHKEE